MLEHGESSVLNPRVPHDVDVPARVRENRRDSGPRINNPDRVLGTLRDASFPPRPDRGVPPVLVTRSDVVNRGNTVVAHEVEDPGAIGRPNRVTDTAKPAAEVE